jgi:hypothetical protein
MSGSKGIVGARGRNGNSGNRCEDINFETTLYSPDPSVLALIKKGDILTIDYTPPKGPLIAVHKGKIAGTIITKLSPQLIVCLESGVKFIGVVKIISGGSCTLQIKTK